MSNVTEFSVQEIMNKCFDDVNKKLNTSAISGPTSSTDNAIVRWDGIGGNVVQNSNVTIDDSGNLIIQTLSMGLKIKEGTNAKQGSAVLVGGTVTVSNTTVTANSRILLTSQVDGGTVGFLRVSARTVGVSFTITSSNVLDTSTIAYLINEPAP